MLQDFERIESPVPGLPGQGRANVCIIGAGAAGILLATQLAEQGLSVLLLEAGGLDLEARSQELYRTELAGHSYIGTTRGRFRTLGGSTTQWGGQLLELEDFDFEPRKHLKGSGWPIRKSDLTPYYERALQFAGLRRVEREDHRVWAGLGLSICDLGPEFHMEYSRWCPERDFSVLRRSELRDSRALQGLYHANAVGFVLNDTQSAVVGVRVRGYEGTEVVLTADRYAMALGGIETNRLLLQPVDGGEAPWQRNGLLGQHFQDHISLNGIPIREVSTQPVARYFGHVSLDNFRYHNKIRLSLQEQVKARSLNVAGTIGPWRKDDPERDAAMVMLREIVRKGRRPSVAEWAKAARYFPGIGWEAIEQRLLGDRPDGGPGWKRLMLSVHSEQSPRSASAITLTEERDALGMLRAKVDWQISELELLTLRTYVKRAMTVFAARRFAKVAPPKGFFEDDELVRSMCSDSYHHMGGTRMSSDPRLGIVDVNLKVHGVENLYVCSSSVFPTGGFSNPTLTILALATRLGDHLRAKAVGEGVWLPQPLERREPMRRVEIPVAGLVKSAKPSPQLGFGCSYLLGPGADRSTSLRLLAAAYDAGIRHFDTARLYGQGECERLLGEFLREHPEATVTTKFGIEPPNLAQRAMTAAGRRVSALAGAARLLRGSGMVKFNSANARASLERSLRALGRERIELFLLHEPERLELVHDDLLRFLDDARTAGKIGGFGIGGEAARVAELHGTRRAYAPVLQFEHSIFSPELSLPDARRIHYRTFVRPAATLLQRLKTEPQLAWWWSEMVGADLQEPSVVSRLLLRASLDQHPGTMTLFSTTHEHHIYENVTVAEDSNLAEAAGRLAKLIRENDLGIGAALHGG
ncbi:aldo/keto reductase [Granulicella paludicola]|uniref:aldo/keto reductase n=1 Tax=Granulicella paludicola TaxID=474951 RepID=UPI0021DFBDCC|nr:aldo/keto reductase [Granulicella paludicola]